MLTLLFSTLSRPPVAGRAVAARRARAMQRARDGRGNGDAGNVAARNGRGDGDARNVAVEQAGL
eukprot:364511-Chlamydomonas_euryale.AAC.8